MLKELTLLCTLLVVVYTIPSYYPEPASFWNEFGVPDKYEPVTFSVALYQRNMEEFKARVLQITNPKSPLYTHYMTKEEVYDMIAPPIEDSERVANYFRSSCEGIKIKNHRDMLRIIAPVHCVETIFDIKMKVYKHIKNDVKIIRKDVSLPNIKVPIEIKEDVELITGISVFPIPRLSKEVPTPGSKVKTSEDKVDATYGFIIPEHIRDVYNIPVGTAVKNSQTTQAAIEFLPVAAPLVSDYKSFAQLADEVYTPYTCVGPVTQGDDGESTLDVQYLYTLAPGATNFYVTISDGWVYGMANTLFTMSNPAQVNSVSYGWPEAGSCQSDITGSNCTGIDSQQFVGKSENELSKVASLGISVIVASQDEGAPSEANENCGLDNTQPVWPIYPSSSAWVTAVSATTIIEEPVSTNVGALPPICNQGYPCANGTFEQPCMSNNTYFSWTTGGGFSNYTTRPSWQNTAVTQYLNSGSILPPTQFFWPNNRAYPEISAVGSRILIVINGGLSVTAGTSASTPIISAIITLLNDARISAGKKPLGFFNQALYQAPTNAFQIINEGNNKCTIGVCCEYGYGNNNGYSAVNGLGTPNFQNLLSYVLSLQ